VNREREVINKEFTDIFFVYFFLTIHISRLTIRNIDNLEQIPSPLEPSLTIPRYYSIFSVAEIVTFGCRKQAIKELCRILL